ncbi:uncharacterized protein [Lepeophtheirus salmonis]|uniref:uncharacterized protein n=1 Tax=Lepeophtheirus salmonis TaxID=72036 RepID=UPI001AE6494E|nr:uncharacterized protein LOC121115439 [Lepeophtheirus salmonis]
MKVSTLAVVSLLSLAALLQAAPSNREERTLGLITTAGAVLGSSVKPLASAATNVIGSAGAAATSALAVASAVKPLIVLGLGKYALWNLINRPGGLSFTAGAGGNNLGLTAGFNGGLSGPSASSGYNTGYSSSNFEGTPAFVSHEPSVVQSVGEWREEPAWTQDNVASAPAAVWNAPAQW